MNLKHILLTADNIFSTGNEAMNENIGAFLDTLRNMKPDELITKYGEKFLWAVITVVIGHFLVHRVLKIIMSRVEKSDLASGATKFISGTATFLLYFIVLLTAANVLGIPVTSVLTIFSVFTLAFSLAIKDIIALFASGITILSSKPFNGGDLIEIPEEGITGYVSEVGLVHTHLFTFDNKEIIIPNSIVAANTIINYSKMGFRRLDSIFSISYNDDFEKAKAVIREVVDNDDAVEKDKEIFIMMNSMSASSIDIICKVYVKWDNYESTRCRLNEKVKLAFDKNGITVPYSQIDVHMK